VATSNETLAASIARESIFGIMSAAIHVVLTSSVCFCIEQTERTLCISKGPVAMLACRIGRVLVAKLHMSIALNAATA
jgi:hypothetical protein